VRGGVGYAVPCALAIAQMCAKHKPSAYLPHPKGYAVMNEQITNDDLEATRADFQKLLVTREMLTAKYGARATARRKLEPEVDPIVEVIEHIEKQLQEKLAGETDGEKIELMQLKADPIIAKIVRELDRVSVLGEWDAGEDITKPPPRGWLLGNMFARRFLSILVAEGGSARAQWNTRSWYHSRLAGH
jgi:hypothetical protein